MKELLTLKEAASLVGKTTKTIKNYIKRGKIKNYFLVDGKFGQEYRINVKDIQPLLKEKRKIPPGKKSSSPGEAAGSSLLGGRPASEITQEDIYDLPEFQFLLRRNDEILMELGRCRESVERLKKVKMDLQQELEEKNMLINLLTNKKPGK